LRSYPEVIFMGFRGPKALRDRWNDKALADT